MFNFRNKIRLSEIKIELNNGTNLTLNIKKNTGLDINNIEDYSFYLPYEVFDTF